MQCVPSEACTFGKGPKGCSQAREREHRWERAQISWPWQLGWLWQVRAPLLRPFHCSKLGFLLRAKGRWRGVRSVEQGVELGGRELVDQFLIGRWWIDRCRNPCWGPALACAGHQVLVPQSVGGAFMKPRSPAVGTAPTYDVVEAFDLYCSCSGEGREGGFMPQGAGIEKG